MKSVFYAVLAALLFCAGAQAKDSITPPQPYLSLYPDNQELLQNNRTQYQKLASQLAPLLGQCKVQSVHEPSDFMQHDSWQRFTEACKTLQETIRYASVNTLIRNRTQQLNRDTGNNTVQKERNQLIGSVAQTGLEATKALQQAANAYGELRLLQGGPRLPFLQLPFDPADVRGEILQLWDTLVYIAYNSMLKTSSQMLDNGHLSASAPTTFNVVFATWQTFAQVVLSDESAAVMAGLPADVPVLDNINASANILALMLMWTNATNQLAQSAKMLTIVIDPPNWGQ